MSSPDHVVEVVFARPDLQRVVTVPWREGLTVRAAVETSGLTREFAELSGQPLLLGIFGRRVADDEPVRAGDRVELYRPLKSDPREARRRSAAAERPRRRSRGG